MCQSSNIKGKSEISLYLLTIDERYPKLKTNTINIQYKHIKLLKDQPIYDLLLISLMLVVPIVEHYVSHSHSTLHHVELAKENLIIPQQEVFSQDLYSNIV